MDITPWLVGHSVPLVEMLDGREARAIRQRRLLSEGAPVLVCFTLNMAGPVKVHPLSEETFLVGMREIRSRLELAQLAVRREEMLTPSWGWEAYFLIDADCRAVKRVLTALEEEHPLGRLFDIDVLDSGGNKVSREEFGYPPRRCLICGETAAVCARSRTHTVAELQERTLQLMITYFRREGLTPSLIGRICRMALLQEVYTTPKPGLVDRRNTGAHQDMDVPLFEVSAHALESYFADCFRIGEKHAGAEAGELLQWLRPRGQEAEQAMFSATDGINTHKGMIFSLGILCGVCGWRSCQSGAWRAEDLLLASGRAAQPALQSDFAEADGKTAGERQYLAYGIAGIRGEAASGFASIRETAWPFFQAKLAEGSTFEEAGVWTLLLLISRVEDTNMIKRGGREVQQQMQQQAAALLSQGTAPMQEEVFRLDELFIEKNVSPGGCADLLAILYFLWYLEQLHG